MFTSYQCPHDLMEFIIIMDYKIGTKVYTDGTLLGTIASFVASPHSHQITHLLIEQSANNTLKIIALELIDIQTKRAIVLPRDTLWDDLPDFNATQYRSINGNSHILVPKPYLHPLYYYPQIQMSDVDQASPDIVDDILNIGMSVYDSNAQNCGIVVAWKQDEAGHITAMVIHVPNDGEHDVQIPIKWISYTKVQEVYLDVEYSALIS